MKAYTVKYLKIILNLSLWILGAWLLLRIVPRLLLFFMPFIVGWLIALMANPIVRFLERRLHIIRKHGSAILILTVISLIVCILYLLMSKLISEIIGFTAAFPEIYRGFLLDFSQIRKNLSDVYHLFPTPIRENILRLSENLTRTIPKNMKILGGETLLAAGVFAKNIPAILINIIITMMSSYFILIDKEHLSNLFQHIVNDAMMEKAEQYFGGTKKIIGGYFKAQFKIMMVVNVILLIGFLILRIKYALLLAVLIALLDFLPFFGTGTVLIPWALLKLFSLDYRYAFGLFLIYLVSQAIRHLIQPQMLSDSMGLNPLLTLLFLYIGYKMGSVIGMIISVPFGMLLINLYHQGFFDSLLDLLQEIFEDINRFRKLR